MLHLFVTPYIIVRLQNTGIYEIYNPKALVVVLERSEGATKGLRVINYARTYIPYTEKLSRGKTFAVVHKTHHSLENFHGASGPCHYVLYTASDSRGKLSRLAKKPRKFPPRKFCHIR